MGTSDAFWSSLALVSILVNLLSLVSVKALASASYSALIWAPVKSVSAITLTSSIALFVSVLTKSVVVVKGTSSAVWSSVPALAIPLTSSIASLVLVAIISVVVVKGTSDAFWSSLALVSILVSLVSLASV